MLMMNLADSTVILNFNDFEMMISQIRFFFSSGFPPIINLAEMEQIGTYQGSTVKALFAKDLITNIPNLS